MKHLHRIVAVWSVVFLLLAGCSKSGSSEPQAPRVDRIELTDGESSRDFSAEGGTWQIDFEASADWTAEQVIPIVVQWYHFTPRQGKAGAGSVTVTGCRRLTDLYCYDNRLEQLDLEPLTAILEGLYCPGKRLTELDLTNAPWLWELYCRDNPILAEIPEAFDRLQLFEHDARYEYRTETDPTAGEERIAAIDTGRGWWYPGEPEKGAHER